MSQYYYKNDIDIGLAVGRDRNQRLLSELFGRNSIIEISDSVPDQVDICLVDLDALQSDPGRFTHWRERNSPVFSPIVILTENDPSTVRTKYNTESQPQFDSIIEIPISKSQLQDRIDNLIQRQKTSQEFHEEKQLTESVFDSSPLAKLVIAPDGTIERANRRAGELFNIDHSELIEQTYTSGGRINLHQKGALTIEDGSWVTDVFETADAVSDHECVIHRPDGEDVITLINAVPIFRDNRSVKHVLVTLEDVTDRRQQAEELERQVDLFTKAEDIASVGAWEYNPQTDELYWTDAVYDIYQLPCDVVIDSKLAIESFHPADRSKIKDAFEEAVESGTAYDIELRLLTHNDELRWVRTRGEPQITDGDVVRVRGTIQDITGRKQRQRKLEKIETLFNNAQDSLFLIDTDDSFTIDQVNNAWEEATGYSAEAVRGLTPTELLGEQQGSEVLDKYHKCVEKQESLKYEERLQFRETTVWWETQIAPVVIDGTVSYIAGSTRDITEKKKRRKKLQQMTNAVDKAPVGIVVSDPTQTDNPLIYVNDGFVEQTGYSRKEATGRNCRFLQGEETDETTVAALRRAIDAEEPISVTIRNYRADETAYWNQLEIAPITDSTGTVINYIGFQQDVTKEEERKTELKQTKERLELVLSATDTGVWTYNPAEDTVLPIQIPKGIGLNSARYTGKSYLEQIRPSDRESVRTAIRTAIDTEEEFTVKFRLNNEDEERWFRSHGTVVTDEKDSSRVVGITTEVTEQVRQQKALEKRERILRELHRATRELYPPQSKQHVAKILVGFLETAVGFECISIKLFDDQEGILEPEITTDTYTEYLGSTDTISPGSNPIWEVYRTGETDVVSIAEFGSKVNERTQLISHVLVAPIDDFGVIVIGLKHNSQFTDVDLDLVEVVTANAEAMFRGLERVETQTELANQLSTQSSHIGELQTIVDKTQAIQERLSKAEAHQELDEAVCEELIDLDRVDLAWIGRPRATDVTLTPTASAGSGMDYIDTVRSNEDDSLLPATIAANEQTVYTNKNISTTVRGTEWAKEALSLGYQSVMSVPLVDGNVIYATVTAYSKEKQAFDDKYKNLLTDTASLLLNYTQILDQRSVGSNNESTIVTFEFDDTVYPLQRLANAMESEVYVKTITQKTKETLTLLLETTADDLDSIREYINMITQIESFTSFGTDESDQLLVDINRPSIITKIEKQGGKFITSVSRSEQTQMWIEIPNNISQRPLFEFVNSQFDNTELVAREESTAEPMSNDDTLKSLTERQLEVLSAAYYGGYYETPRRVTGEDLADSFDISSPAVYNHLQAAHKKILKTLLKNNQYDIEPVLDD